MVIFARLAPLHTILVSFKTFNLRFEASDYFLTFVCAFGQLFFDLLVQRDVAFKNFYLLGHLVMGLH